MSTPIWNDDPDGHYDVFPAMPPRTQAEQEIVAKILAYNVKVAEENVRRLDEEAGRADQEAG